MCTRIQKKRAGFSLLELSVAICLVTILLQVSFRYYRDYRDTLDLRLAKEKISKTFHLYSLKSFYEEKEYYFLVSDIEKKMRIRNSSFRTEKEVVLPSRLSFYLTSDSVRNLKYGHLTKHGNIHPSFSIYLFNSSGQARYKISFSSFQETKLLRIRYYKKISGEEIPLKNISDYHKKTNDKRELFLQDWKEERG